MRAYPALDVRWPALAPGDPDLVLAAVDDHAPLAVEDHADGLRLFFSSSVSRDAARQTLAASGADLTLVALEVDDENWAERSQAALTAITIGRITVAPPWAAPGDPTDASAVHIVIEPSMGFGTGHHASTRLCLELLQRYPPVGGRVLDVGTGSGVLGIAAWRLGATSVMAVDSDPDAIEAAADSVARNQAQQHVQVAVHEITNEGSADRYDLTFANLTGGLLIRIAPVLIGALTSGGSLIASGFQVHERDEVQAALVAAGAELVDESSEDGWVGIRLRQVGR